MKPFLLEDESKDIKSFVKQMIKGDSSEGDYLKSGGIKVELESIPLKKDEKWLFSVYRLIGTIQVKEGEHF